MKLVSQDRAGLLPHQRAHGIAAPTYQVRATPAVIEALGQAGATVTPDEGDVYTVALGQTMPEGIVSSHVDGPHCDALRLAWEPKYPREFVDIWKQANWTPCPECGSPVVWYEAGYVPGYRVCTGKLSHHSLVRG